MTKITILALASTVPVIFYQVNDALDLNSLLDYGLLGLLVVALVAVINRMTVNYNSRISILESELARQRDKYETLLMSLVKDEFK